LDELHTRRTKRNGGGRNVLFIGGEEGGHREKHQSSDMNSLLWRGGITKLNANYSC